MTSAGRHKGEESLPKIHLVAGPLQFREPITPWGATQVKFRFGLLPFAVQVKFKCLYAPKPLQRDWEEECHDCCGTRAAESHKHFQRMP